MTFALPRRGKTSESHDNTNMGKRRFCGCYSFGINYLANHRIYFLLHLLSDIRRAVFLGSSNRTGHLSVLCSLRRPEALLSESTCPAMPLLAVKGCSFNSAKRTEAATSKGDQAKGTNLFSN